MGPALKDILTKYGCDSACLDSVPLDVVTIAQATAYCSCPAVIDVQPVNFKSMDISKLLKYNKIPKTLKKRTTKAETINLVSTPEMVPQTNYYMTGVIFLAAMVAGGFVYNKNQKGANTKNIDTFSVLLW